MVAIILTALRLPDIGSGNWAHITLIPTHSKNDNGCTIVTDINIGICAYMYAELRLYSDAGHSFCPCGITLFLVEMVDRLGTYPECRVGGDLNRCLLCCDLTIRMSTVGAFASCYRNGHLGLSGWLVSGRHTSV